MNAGLTQVLSDGTTTYLYGNGRIGEYTGTDWAYHLGDALGSVRQVSNNAGGVTLTNTYEPYGSLSSSAGTSTTNYGFANEWTDGTGLQHLRARYLDTGIGRFLTRDVWGGDYNNPMSLNKWMYVQGNPVNYIDPTGLKMICLDGEQCFDTEIDKESKMEQDFDKLIDSLETRLHQEGLGIEHWGYILFTPEEALIFLDELTSLDLDLAILGTTLWDRDKDGEYTESPDRFNFDKVELDDKFVEYSFRETKKYLESLVGDPTIDRLVISFESNKYRQKRLEQIKKSRR